MISGRKVGKPKVTSVRLRDEPFRIFSPLYGIIWETKYGRFITLKIPKYEHFKRKNDKLTLPLYVRCSFWWPYVVSTVLSFVCHPCNSVLAGIVGRISVPVGLSCRNYIFHGFALLLGRIIRWGSNFQTPSSRVSGYLSI